MDADFDRALNGNSLRFKMSLDRIAEKYSKLQGLDGGIEVDLVNMKHQTLQRQLEKSRRNLINLESKLDFTDEDGRAESESASSSHGSGYDDGMQQSNMTELTVGSFERSVQNISETELQPEDQDEELEMTLRSQGSSFADLYPSMISRIEKACKRQNLSRAADSVLKRYQRWRLQSREGSLNNTLRHSKPGQMAGRMQLKGTSIGPERRQIVATESAPRSPLKFTTNQLALQAHQPSPVKDRSPLRRERHHSPCLIDRSRHFFKTCEQQEGSLNQTYSMSEQSGEQPYTYVGSPSRPCYPTAKSSDLSLRSRRHSFSEQAPGCSMYSTEVSFPERSIYSSPVRQSPLKSRLMNNLGRSPYTSYWSPKDGPMESFSREPVRGRSLSSSLSSPPQRMLYSQSSRPSPPQRMLYSQSSRPSPPQRMLYSQSSRPSPQRQLHSPQPASRPKIRRHLSFDSSLPSIGASYSPKELDEEFLRLYHKFVCLNKSSFFNSHPCRMCVRCPESSRAHSSSALAALALSPHRSILRKRNRELGWADRPLSKRARDECYTSSPGSKRNVIERLRRRLSGSELSRDDLFYRSTKHNMCNKFSMQPHTVDARQQAGMRPNYLFFSGGSHQSSTANGFSPRKIMDTDQTCSETPSPYRFSSKFQFVP